MASVIREAVIEASPSQCWDALRDFAGLHERLAKGFVTDAKMISSHAREVTFASGAVAIEVLVGIDEPSMRLAYMIADGPLGASHYNAAAQVIPETDQRSRFLWIIDVLPDELADLVGKLMDAGLSAIKQTLEARDLGGPLTPSAAPTASARS